MTVAVGTGAARGIGAATVARVADEPGPPAVLVADAEVRGSGQAHPRRPGGAPADIAQAVSFFADERAGFVSGQVLYVAGGPVE